MTIPLPPVGHYEVGGWCEAPLRWNLHGELHIQFSPWFKRLGRWVIYTFFRKRLLAYYRRLRAERAERMRLRRERIFRSPNPNNPPI